MTGMHESFTKPVDLLAPNKSHKRKWLVVAISLFAGLFLLALFFFTRIAPQKYGITLHPKQSILQTVKNIIFPDEFVLEGQKEDRINILLLGMGGPGHDGPYLTDTNIIVSIKPSTNEVAMVSVPRDLGVTVGDAGVRKINYADAYGEIKQPGFGGDFARQVFSETFAVSIPYYVRVDFTAFTDMINNVGGITVDVPTTFTDSAFPGPNFSYRTIHFDAGPQTMDGDTALDFARSRHGNNGEGSDFARSRRQQLVIAALKDKLLSANTYTNTETIRKLWGSVASHVATNLNEIQLAYLVNLSKNLNRTPRTLVLDNAPGGFLVSTTGDSGAFLLFPKTGDYTSIQTAINDVFSSTFVAANPITTSAPQKPIVVPAKVAFPTTASTSLSSLRIEIQNGTWRAGLAARYKDRLQEKRFSVLTVGNSLKKPIDKTAIYLLNSASSMEAAKALSNELKAPILTVIPEWLKQGYNNPDTSEDETGMKYNLDADVLVILGTDTPN